MRRNEIKDKVVKMLRSVMGGHDDIDGDDTLTGDLRFDELDMLETVIETERAFGIDITPDEETAMFSVDSETKVDDIITLISRKLEGIE